MRARGESDPWLIATVALVGLSVGLASITFLAAMAAMTFELLTCYWATKPSKRGAYRWGREIGDKLMILSLIVPALFLDWLIVYAGFLFDADFAGIPRDWLPVTSTTLLWVFVAQSLKGIEHVRTSQGDENIPLILLWVLRQLRKADQARYDKPGELPHRRAYDDLTEQDIQALIDRMKAEAGLDPPPAPLTLEQEDGKDG